MRLSMTVKSFVGATAAAISIASLSAISSANASPVQVSDTMTIFGPAGNIVGQVSADESQPEGGGQFFSIPGFSVNPLIGPTFLSEPDLTFSDIFGVCSACGPDGTPALAFLSDTNVTFDAAAAQQAFGGLGAIVRIETDSFFDATQYLSPDLIAQGFTARFQSDVEAATPIPAALPLFASGLGLMGWLSRRRKRDAALAAA